MWLSKFTIHSLKLKSIEHSALLRSIVKGDNFISIQIRKRSTIKTMETQEPILKIPQGLIKGLKRKTIYDHDFYSFEGIPYAQPPLGELRFKAPVPAGNWTDVRDCRESDLKPLQKNHLGVAEGTEDCLYLNVFAKQLQPKEKLPVMVWIYGGAFNTGSGIRTKYSPDYFMQKNVILVTFNYRLSSLGFLSLADPSCEVPGNAGLKDQVMALKWVKDNISYFGGDEQNITLFGESAGGASVHFMAVTEQTKGLFHKAICMSGCISNPWAFSGISTDLPYRLACEKGYSGANEDKLVLEYLRKLPAEQLVLIDKLNLEAVGRGGFYAFIPSLEPYDNEGSVIRKPLEDLIKSGWGNEIPMMIGGTSFEGLVRYSQIKKKPVLEIFNAKPELYFPAEVQKKLTEEKRDLLVAKVKELHFKDTNEIMGFMDYDSYISFWEGLYRFIKSRQCSSTAPTYQYVFDFDSPTFNHHRTMFCNGDINTGVAHADDLSYIFYAYYSWKLEKDSREYLTIQRMIKMWTNFAKNSNPNCEFTKESPWQTVEESDAKKWFRISNDLKFEEMPEDFKRKLDFWVGLYDI
ncbi:esterase B1-like [Lucilia sericata]|uniref:esterase B1-like n=1 Tax=Lucilia sericata TaxID=13632 RepID=UPI0018A828BB|nr:esterase B1-like [Lucilia sericata]